jgi:hypothetical protein
MIYQPETDPGNQLTRIRSIFFMRRRRLGATEVKYTLRSQEAQVVTGISSRQYGAGIHVLYRVRATAIMYGIN